MATSYSTALVPAPAPESDRGAPPIELDRGAAPGEVVVRLTGEGGIALAGELTGALLPLSAVRPPLVTVDLGGLTAISCLAMGALVTFRRAVVRVGGQVRLGPGLRPTVRQALERAGLLDLFGWPEGE